MKKITYFLTALFTWMFAVSASAEGGVTVATSYTAASELTDGYYVLKTRCKGKNGYIYHNPNDGDRPFRQKPEANTPLTNLANNMEYVWKLTKNTDGAFTLQNVSTGGYMPAYDGNGGNFANSTVVANAAKYKFSNFTAYENSLEGGVLLYETNFTNTRYVHCNEAGEPNLSYWAGGEAKDDGSVVQFAFYKVNNLVESQIASYTINYKIGDQTISSTTRNGVKDQTTVTITKPTEVSYYLTLTSEPTDLVLSETNKTFDVVYSKGTVPFEFSTGANKVWYTIKFRNDENKSLIYASPSEAYIASNGTISEEYCNNKMHYYTLEGALWAFVEDGFGVKLLNKQSGKYVACASADKAKATFNANGTTFIVKTCSFNNNSGFSLQTPGTPKIHLGDHASDYFGAWSADEAGKTQNDEGSSFSITKMSDKSSLLTIGKATLKAPITGDKLNAFNSANLKKYETEIDAATDIEGLSTIKNKIAAAAFVPEVNTYYRIKNVNLTDTEKSYISSEDATVGTNGKLTAVARIRRKPAANSLIPQIWKAVANADGNSCQLVNANVACSMGNYDGSGIQLLANETVGSYSVKAVPSANFAGNDGFTMLQLNIDGKRINAFQGNSNDIIADYNDNHDGDKGNYWQFIKVTTVPVNISAANYATVAYPFAVKVPAESGVKAYAVSDVKNGVLVLSEITDGIIAANTGAILYHEGEKQVNLQITTDEATYTGENKLQGATAKRTGFTANDTYVLALNSANQAAFLKSELTTVPANKAYVLASALPAAEAGAQALNFGFGEVTGINGVNADSNNAVEYYDLNGRRVLYPANGIFVTNTGKKVFIK